MSTTDKLVPGMVLGRYELLVPIAKGGMATVWAARQRGTRGFTKTVAVKTMLPALSEDPQFEQMFLDEAALAAKIHHPHVAEILDLGEQDEILYIVMEWVDGEALSVLSKALRKNSAHMPLRLSLRIAVQACAALHAAHELRDENDVPLMLVHRDVSPQNILCTYDGIVKLVDFGVAKAVGRAGGETTAGQLKGKVPYMSPEQARGGQVDRRTDIFALGIVLYKLTTDLHPFLGENDIVTMRNIISRPVLPPRVKNPDFSLDVQQIILKCLQKDPDRRYQTMPELASALESALLRMGVESDDLGAFVRNTMGDRGARRRAEIREAVRIADERFATGVHARVAAPSPATTHEDVSDVVLTKMSTGVTDDPLGIPSSISSGAIPPPPPSSAGSWSGVEARPSEPQTTEQPVVVAAGTPRRLRRPGVLLGVAGAVVAVVAGLLVLRPGRGGIEAHGASPRSFDAPPPATSVPETVPVATVTPTAAEAVTPTATAAAMPAVTVAPTATPAAKPAQSVAALPEGQRSHGKSQAAAATAKPAPSAAADAPAHDIASGKVRIYTNPGF